MKIKMLENCVGNRFSYSKGATVTVADKVGKDLVKAGYAESLGKGKKSQETSAEPQVIEEIDTTTKEELSIKAAEAEAKAKAK